MGVGDAAQSDLLRGILGFKPNLVGLNNVKNSNFL